jgi:hypothetical protein
MINKGSEWRKWNFHVHTKGTNKNDQFISSTLEEFFQDFLKKAVVNNISAIGITDYFSIEKYLETIKYVEKIDEKVDTSGKKVFSLEEINFIKKIFIFPNVELRMLPATDKGRLINIHCLFNPDYVKHLENDFLGHIENQDNFKMNRHGLTEYGKSLDSTITDENKLYKKGVDNFVIDLTTLKNLISKNPNFHDNCLLVVSNSNKDGASAVQQHYDLFDNEEGALDGLRKSIYKISHSIFSANSKDIKYFLGNRLEGTEGYNEEIYEKEKKKVIEQRGSIKACLVGCDSHSEATLFNKFTWVKSALTFEGLRQICFEPEQRVRIQNDKPDFKEEKVIIDKVKFESANKTFNDEEIHLNQNLNVIIGGKSSGKSILLYSIAKTLLPDGSILKNENGDEKYDFKTIATDYNFSLTTKAGVTQKMFRSSEENSIIPDLKYIPQNYLVKLAEPEVNKKGKSLNKLVRDLINEDDDSKSRYDQFIRNVKQNDKERDLLIDKYFELIEDISKIETDLKTKSNKEVLEKNIATNSKKVEELNKKSGLSDKQLEEYKIVQNKIALNNSKASNFKDDFTSINKSLAEINRLVTDVSNKKGELLDELKTPSIKQYYSDKLLPIDAIVSLIAESIKEIQVEKYESDKSRFPNANILKSTLELINSEKKSLNIELEPFQQNQELKKQIETLNQSISDDHKLLMDIEALTKNITSKKFSILECQDNIFSLYEQNYKEYIKVIDELKSRTFQLENDGLKIEGVAQFNFHKFYKTIYGISDGRRASYNNYQILTGTKKATSETNYTEIVDEIKKLFIDVLSNNYSIVSKVSKKNAIKSLLDDYFFDYWKIAYKNDKLGEMSTGKASFVILMLIIGLSKSKSPILIDQPEDNLDNRSITSDLVHYLKNKKLERQIIIVTHNANIVVNSDSENIIIANQKGQSAIESSSEFRFDYINGAIENSFEKKTEEKDLLKSMGVREHIADIVEGGKDAFILREKKYRF